MPGGGDGLVSVVLRFQVVVLKNSMDCLMH